MEIVYRHVNELTHFNVTWKSPIPFNILHTFTHVLNVGASSFVFFFASFHFSLIKDRLQNRRHWDETKNNRIHTFTLISYDLDSHYICDGWKKCVWNALLLKYIKHTLISVVILYLHLFLRLLYPIFILGNILWHGKYSINMPSTAFRA